MPFAITHDNVSAFSKEVNALVRNYIDTQNSVFKFSFMKALGLKKVDFSGAADKAEGLLGQANALLEQVRELKLNAAEPLDAFFMTMRPYLRGVSEALSFFIKLCRSAAIAERDKKSSYRKEAFQNDLLELQRLEQEYLKIGLELNERWKELHKSAS